MNEVVEIPIFTTWLETVEYRENLLLQAIAMQENFARNNGGDDEVIKSLTAPYYELLKILREHDIPKAIKMDTAEEEYVESFHNKIRNNFQTNVIF